MKYINEYGLSKDILRYAIYIVDDWAVAYDVDTGLVIYEDHSVDHYILQNARQTPILIEHYAYHDELEEYVMDNGYFPKTHKEILDLINDKISSS